MATVDDIARLVEGAGDYDEAIARCQSAGLATEISVNRVLVGATTAIQLVGGNVRANAYWVVYDLQNPEKSKVKVRGKT